MDTGNLPFTEHRLDNLLERTFSVELTQGELTWHRDREDRLLIVNQPTNWKIQLDNQLPKEINNTFIGKGIWHRLIKGDNELKITIKIL